MKLKVWKETTGAIKSNWKMEEQGLKWKLSNTKLKTLISRV
jgi:hypothetical protein